MKYEDEFLTYVDEIINSEEFQKRKKYEHHENESVYEHSLKVAYSSYLYAKKHNLNKRDISIGGILHDFYYKPWKENTENKPLFKKHGFVHAKEALENSKKHFNNLLNKKIENIILRHMFPLNIVPPKYLESWIVSISDKIVSMDLVKNKDMLISIGLKKRSNKNE